MNWETRDKQSNRANQHHCRSVTHVTYVEYELTRTGKPAAPPTMRAYNSTSNPSSLPFRHIRRSSTESSFCTYLNISTAVLHPLLPKSSSQFTILPTSYHSKQHTFLQSTGVQRVNLSAQTPFPLEHDKQQSGFVSYFSNLITLIVFIFL